MSNNSAQLATRLLTSLAATFGAYGAYKALSFFYDNWTSTIRRLPGPPSSSFIWGNMKEIFDAVCSFNLSWATSHLNVSQENSALHEQWVKEYGKTIRYKGILGVRVSPLSSLRGLI
jgi:hypothetical protein